MNETQCKEYLDIGKDASPSSLPEYMSTSATIATILVVYMIS